MTSKKQFTKILPLITLFLVFSFQGYAKIHIYKYATSVDAPKLTKANKKTISLFQKNKKKGISTVKVLLGILAVSIITVFYLMPIKLL